MVYGHQRDRHHHVVTLVYGSAPMQESGTAPENNASLKRLSFYGADQRAN
jgi:hypothetical protein